MPNEQIWLGVSGMSDPTIEEQITPEMLFDIGSTGKNYLAALMGTWRFHTWISVNRNVPARLRNDDIGNDQW
jgi:hypothetical protein